MSEEVGPTRVTAVVRYPLVRPPRIALERISSTVGLHPDLVRRFVALGLVEATRDAAGQLWFDARAPAAIARAQRLRSGLALNWAGIGVVMDLLDRIEALEAALRRAGVPRPGEEPIQQARSEAPWT